jgi:hypothetical protein
MILNFEHHSAAHCEAGVVSNQLNFYGYQLSEPMVFGIGAGLFFAYLPFVSYKGNMTKFSFRTMPGAIFSQTMKNLHVKTGMKKRFLNKDKAMQEVDKLLAAGIPVGTVIGLFFLPYTPIRIHFNAHHLCVVGKEGDEYTVSDPTVSAMQKLSYNNLKKVRFAEGAFKPRGKMYWIKEKPTIPSDLRPAIMSGIKKTCRNMVGIPFSPLGVQGIVLLSKQIRKLETKYGEQEALIFLATLLQSMEEFGTGGAGFRFVYSAFLQEAAEMLNEPALNDFSIKMTEIGDLWRQFALECGRKIKNRSNASCNDLADKLLEVATAEKIFFTELKKYVKTAHKKIKK